MSRTGEGRNGGGAKQLAVELAKKQMVEQKKLSPKIQKIQLIK